MIFTNFSLKFYLSNYPGSFVIGLLKAYEGSWQGSRPASQHVPSWELIFVSWAWKISKPIKKLAGKFLPIKFGVAVEVFVYFLLFVFDFLFLQTHSKNFLHEKISRYNRNLKIWRNNYKNRKCWSVRSHAQTRFLWKKCAICREHWYNSLNECKSNGTNAVEWYSQPLEIFLTISCSKANWFASNNNPWVFLAICKFKTRTWLPKTPPENIIEYSWWKVRLREFITFFALFYIY